MSPIGPVGGASISFRPNSYGRFEAVEQRAQDQALSRQRINDLRRIDSDLSQLRELLEGLAGQAAGLGRAGGSKRGHEASAISRSALDVGGPTFTTLRSTGEINAIPTSFSPFGPSVNGNSTTLPTIGGVYDGDQGDDTLTFEFRQNRQVGDDALRIRVYDGSGRRIQTLRYDNLAPGTPVTLRNGLTLSLSAGSVSRRDTFQVQVFESVGSVVDTSKPFDGTRNDQPNLEPGLAVSAGTFEVNGVSIDVAADDSIDSVLAKISASGAGVDATFDSASERIVLTSTTPGSEGRVVLANDTSGFLAATKLATAVEVLGSDSEDTLFDPIAEVAALSGITAGLFQVNGLSIDVDPAQDSLADVIDRINGSEAGARASFDPSTQRFSIASTASGQPISLADGDTGFFSTLQIEPGVYEASRRGGGSTLPFQRRRELREDLLDTSRAFEDLMRRELGKEATDDVSPLRESLGALLEARLGGSAARAASRVGFSLDRAEGGPSFGVDSQRLEQALRGKPRDVHALLFGERSEPGLLEALSTELDAVQGQLDALLGRGSSPRGLVDLFA
ncbi:MAG: hypothetical protein HKP30_14485 [Myxococcales bacterium]|nr:hypothetical protein [Myxococcales bacterium]